MQKQKAYLGSDILGLDIQPHQWIQSQLGLSFLFMCVCRIVTTEALVCVGSTIRLLDNSRGVAKATSKVQCIWRGSSMDDFNVQNICQGGVCQICVEYYVQAQLRQDSKLYLIVHARDIRSNWLPARLGLARSVDAGAHETL